MFSVMAWPRRAAVLASSALPVVVAAALLGTALWLLARLVPTPRARLASTALLGLLVPSFLLAVTGLLLFDNFTKTLFGFNVGSFASPWRYLYALGLLAAVVVILRRLRRFVEKGEGRRWRLAGRGLAAVVAILFLVAAWRYDPPHEATELSLSGGRPRVNVLILSSDGIDAERMSVYGAERATTPFLDSRVDEFLVSDNHVSNAAVTAGSTGSLLTGKQPILTGVTEMTQVFQGRDVYEHLPGLLRQLGYYGFEIGIRGNADSHDFNLRLGFHRSNGRELTGDGLASAEWYGRRFPAESHFLSSVAERATERLRHAFGLADMVEFSLVSHGPVKNYTPDETRIAMLKEELVRAPRPYFGHVHLLDTHQQRIGVSPARFAGHAEATDLDRLDDGILAYDGFIEEMVGFLEERGELDDTILILNTDHGHNYETSQRLPLLIRFPRGEPRGHIRPTTQRIDIAPTLLGYLGVPPPAWMKGDSLLGELDPKRLLFIAGRSEHVAKVPVALVQCQRWYRFHPGTGELERATLRGHTAPCPEDELIDEEEGRARILALLDESSHFTVPLMLGGKLFRLRLEDDPELRAEILRQFPEKVHPVRRLDDEMALAWLHWNFWTFGSLPAAVVVTNPHDEPLVRRLTVRAAKEHDFPMSFEIDDGESRTEHTFARPGEMTIELAPVAPRGKRLFVVWSNAAVRPSRSWIGVRLGASFSDRLERLVRRPDPAERARTAREIVEGETTRRLGPDLLVANTYWDFWSLGDHPVAVVARNPLAPEAAGGNPLAPEAKTPRLEVRSGGGGEFPRRLWIDDGETTRQLVFERPGSLEVELSPVAAGGERLFILWTDQSWRPSGGDRRTLGIRLAAAR